jgi:fructose-bisphosphate aldolase class 1
LKETEWEEGEASDKEIKDILKQLNALKNSEQTSAIAKKMREILKTDDTKPMNDCIEAVKREKNLSSDVDFYGLKGSLSLLNPEGEMTMRGSYTRK